MACRRVVSRVPDLEQVVGVHEPGRKHERFLGCRIDAIPGPDGGTPLLSRFDVKGGYSLDGVGYVLVDRRQKECLKLLWRFQKPAFTVSNDAEEAQNLIGLLRLKDTGVRSGRHARERRRFVRGIIRPRIPDPGFRSV